MSIAKQNLIEAEGKAEILFTEIENRGLIVAGKAERELNKDIFDLAFELYGIDKYWHKRIVRAGKNTLKPYDENPKDLTLQKDDILFIDFGPIFDEWEADFGRTYVLGNDPIKHKIKQDTAKAWAECKAYFDKQTEITGAEFYTHVVDIAHQYGWEFGGEIAG
ncbi:MAG: Xaa-Pro dipeptidase, partial [Sediminicola sp.]